MAEGDRPDKDTVADEGAPTLLPDGPFRLSRDVVLRYQEQLASRVGSLLVIAGTQADIELVGHNNRTGITAQRAGRTQRLIHVAWVFVNRSLKIAGVAI